MKEESCFLDFHPEVTLIFVHTAQSATCKITHRHTHEHTQQEHTPTTHTTTTTHTQQQTHNNNKHTTTTNTQQEQTHNNTHTHSCPWLLAVGKWVECRNLVYTIFKKHPHLNFSYYRILYRLRTM